MNTLINLGAMLLLLISGCSSHPDSINIRRALTQFDDGKVDIKYLEEPKDFFAVMGSKCEYEDGEFKRVGLTTMEKVLFGFWSAGVALVVQDRWLQKPSKMSYSVYATETNAYIRYAIYLKNNDAPSRSFGNNDICKIYDYKALKGGDYSIDLLLNVNSLVKTLDHLGAKNETDLMDWADEIQ